MPITIKDVQIQTSDKPQIIVSDLQNKKFIMWGDLNNADNIFVGDQTVKRYVASSQLAAGLIVIPFGSANTVYNNLEEIFVDDSNKFYMVGKAGDLLHVLILESVEIIAVQQLIAGLALPSFDPITNRLDQIIALLSKLAKV